MCTTRSARSCSSRGTAPRTGASPDEHCRRPRDPRRYRPGKGLPHGAGLGSRRRPPPQASTPAPRGSTRTAPRPARRHLRTYEGAAARGARALDVAASWVHERHDDVEVATDVLDGHPAQILIRQSGRARMIVLGSRHLSRTEEFLSAGSLVVPVSAQARCPVVVVGDAEHVTQEPPYLVVGVDGSESSSAALALAFEEASLRGAAVRALWVWQSPVLFSLKDEPTLVQTQRSLLSETVAGWAEKYPDVALTHEVPVGHPVEELARAAEHALAVVVGRRGKGGYMGMRLGSVVHGLLHRAHCPVITVPVR
ncbi:universal stress protein [Streptomyces sp. NPDC048425]|uniref:universal stress protein n=1 Tax=Streptomyces sp. NPDC048425 TaxID=3365548 RepID=UPI0037215A9F